MKVFHVKANLNCRKARKRKIDPRAHPVVHAIHERMEAAGTLVEKACTKAGIEPATYRKWRTAETSPRLEALEALANVVGLEITVKPAAPSQQRRAG